MPRGPTGVPLCDPRYCRQAAVTCDSPVHHAVDHGTRTDPFCKNSEVRGSVGEGDAGSLRLLAGLLARDGIPTPARDSYTTARNARALVSHFVGQIARCAR